MGRRKKTPEPDESGAVKTASGSSVTLELTEHLRSLGDVNVSIRGQKDDDVINKPKFLSTGLPIVDHMLGGGVPAGRLTELFSKGQGLGKSSLAALLMVEMQRQGGEVILMDTEHGFPDKRLEQLGVDLNGVVDLLPDYIEQGAELISQVLKKLKEKGRDESKVLIIWDSITASPSKQEYEADYGDMQVASAARAWSSIIKVLKDEVARSEVYVVLVNQTRTNIGQMFGDKQTSTGGIAIKYYVGTSLVLSRGAGAWLKDKSGQKIGFKVNMMTEKSRVSAPYRVAETYFIFDEGYDRWRALFDLLVKLDIIEYKAGWCSMEGVKQSFKLKDFRETITSLPEEIEEKVTKELKEARLTDLAIQYFFPNYE